MANYYSQNLFVKKKKGEGNYVILEMFQLSNLYKRGYVNSDLRKNYYQQSSLSLIYIQWSSLLPLFLLLLA